MGDSRGIFEEAGGLKGWGEAKGEEHESVDERDGY